MNKEIETVEAKHIFIDVVNYTYKRSVEAQSSIVEALNNIVNTVIDQLCINRQNIIFIPTGDGMCISLVNILNPFDVHIQIGILILEKLQVYNSTQENNMRKFSLRIGINENIDNLIIDINGNRNISGSGINYASRIKDLGDGNQILVGNSVYDKLIQREKYMESFTSYDLEVKHNYSLKFHQYKDYELGYLNNNPPPEFRPKANKNKYLSDFEGYYIANCLCHEKLFTENLRPGTPSYSLHIVMFHLAHDSVARDKITKLYPEINSKVKGSVIEYFKIVESSTFWVLADFQDVIKEALHEIGNCFSEPFLFVNEYGKMKLKDEKPDIYKRLVETPQDNNISIDNR